LNKTKASPGQDMKSQQNIGEVSGKALKNPVKQNHGIFVNEKNS
jgi:hypothetical protein